MAETALDEAVKPSPYVTPDQVASVAASVARSPNHAAEIHENRKPSLDTDPTSDLPSSPPQIYLNLLILEASLRSQYLTLRARRRQHVFFLALLGIWIAYFLWTLFLRPREDGQGLGGSVYWVVDMGEKVACMGGILTAILIWATGQWERGVRWPRRWVGISNRGLRGMNLKIVVLKGTWWKRLGSTIALLFPYRSFFHNPGSEFHVIEFQEKKRDLDSNYAYRDGYKRLGAREEDIATGGDTIKLLLLPKYFSPEFRENWELYRTEYWDKENERRATLRKAVRAREREEAKQRGGCLWWTGYRGFGKHKDSKLHDLEKTGAHHHFKDPKSRQLSTVHTHSRSSSRSSTTPTSDLDDIRRGHRKSRIGSVAGSTRHAKSSSRTQVLTVEGDPLKHDEESKTLKKRASTLSNGSQSSMDGHLSDRSTTSSGVQKRSRNRDLVMSDMSDA